MVEEISPLDLHERLDRGDRIQIIDIRPESQFRQGHIPGAENIPFTDFARAVSEVSWENEIVVVCPMGESSRQAARLLESYEAIDDDTWIANLEGGYQEWEFDLKTGNSE